MGKGKRKGREEGREGKGGEGECASLALGGIDAPAFMDCCAQKCC